MLMGGSSYCIHQPMDRNMTMQCKTDAVTPAVKEESCKINTCRDTPSKSFNSRFGLLYAAQNPTEESGSDICVPLTTQQPKPWSQYQRTCKRFIRPCCSPMPLQDTIAETHQCSPTQSTLWSWSIRRVEAGKSSGIYFALAWSTSIC